LLLIDLAFGLEFGFILLALLFNLFDVIIGFVHFINTQLQFGFHLLCLVPEDLQGLLCLLIHLLLLLQLQLKLTHFFVVEFLESNFILDVLVSEFLNLLLLSGFELGYHFEKLLIVLLDTG
jgi:hypothetical protein